MKKPKVIMQLTPAAFDSKYDIAKMLFDLIKTDALPPVILCVGSCRSVGDSLGPLVGHLLTTKHNIRTFVYGTLSRPINRWGVMECARFIRKKHRAKIVAVDAALGSEIYAVKVFKGGLAPAAALGTALPRVGDYAVTANVNYPQKDNGAALKCASFKTVSKIAEKIAFALSDALTLYRAQKNFTCTRFL